MKFQLIIFAGLLTGSLGQNLTGAECTAKKTSFAATATCVRTYLAPCRDVCTGKAVSTDDCDIPECCLVNGECRLKKEPETDDDDNDEFESVKTSFATDFGLTILTGDGSTDSGTTDGDDTRNSSDARSGLLPGYNVGPPQIQLPCQPPPTFPRTCTVLPHTNPNSPPINIPYCQRIACKTSNPFLDNDYRGCLSTPGCFFDEQLFRIRQSYGHALLPAVPVCHSVIRNSAFQRRARATATQLRGGWNPLITNCLLDEYAREIFGPHPGCDAILTFEFFGHPAKRAGWRRIGERGCSLIGGCWLKRTSNRGAGCFYPLDAQGQPTVRSSNDNPTSKAHSADLYGQPVCQPFSASATGSHFLSSYHTCLSSGCAANINSQTLYQNLLALAQELPQSLQGIFLSLIQTNQVRPDNFLDIVNQLQGAGNTGPGVAVPFSANLNSGGTGSTYNGITSQQFYNNFVQNSQGGGGNPPPSSQSGQSSGVVNPNYFASQNGQFVNPFINTQPQIPVSYNPCPYDRVNLQGLGLSGSIEDCCNKPLCYTPKLELNDGPVSGVSSYLYSWSAWASCSKSCGKGTQKRTRMCIGKQPGCFNSIMEETKPCNDFLCPHYGQWTSYGSCTRTCGTGKSRRTRKCMGQGQCEGDSFQEINCNTGACPTFVDGAWGDCSVTCGTGVQTRSRQCTQGGFYGCPRSTSENRPCRVFCSTTQAYCNRRTCCVEHRCSRPNQVVGTHCPPKAQNNLNCCFHRACSRAPPPPPNSQPFSFTV